MADKKQFSTKLKIGRDSMIESMEKHTIALEELLDVVKEIDSKGDRMIEEVDVYKAHYALWDRNKRTNDGSSASGKDRTI